jgi:uncharacterized protein
MQIPTITLATTAILALLASVLAVFVIVQRVRLKVEWGDGGNPLMAQAVRAHANFAEHVPIALLALACSELTGAPRVLVLACAGALILARVLSALGLSRSLGPSISRQAGASITIAVTVIAAITSLVSMG